MIPLTAVAPMRGVGVVPAVVGLLAGVAGVDGCVSGGVAGVIGAGRTEVLVLVTGRSVLVVVLVGSGRTCGAGRTGGRAGGVGHQVTSSGGTVVRVGCGGVVRLVGWNLRIRILSLTTKHWRTP
jgi:hypothetical protein